jgi:hypothetical protein
MAKEVISYDKAEFRAITRSFKAMDDEAATQAKQISGGLVEYLKSKIITKAALRNNKGASRIAEGARISKSSKVGEINLGYASQKFSGGGTTQLNPRQEGGNGLLGGMEFGSAKFKQFPAWSGRFGTQGSRGWFIYPTLREEQPYLVDQWEKGFTQILNEWT